MQVEINDRWEIGVNSTRRRAIFRAVCKNFNYVTFGYLGHGEALCDVHHIAKYCAALIIFHNVVLDKYGTYITYSEVMLLYSHCCDITRTFDILHNTTVLK